MVYLSTQSFDSSYQPKTHLQAMLFVGLKSILRKSQYQREMDACHQRHLWDWNIIKMGVQYPVRSGTALLFIVYSVAIGLLPSVQAAFYWWLQDTPHPYTHSLWAAHRRLDNVLHHIPNGGSCRKVHCSLRSVPHESPGMGCAHTVLHNGTWPPPGNRPIESYPVHRPGSHYCSPYLFPPYATIRR